MMGENRLSKILDRCAYYAGSMAAWLFMPLLLLTAAVALLRYGFNFGHIAAQEAITYLHAFIITLGVSYTWKKDGHVRVDILYNQRSDKKRVLINLIGNLFLLLPVCIGILIISWDYVISAWVALEGSREAGGLPLVFILKSLIPIMAGLLVVQALADIIRQSIQLRA